MTEETLSDAVGETATQTLPVSGIKLTQRNRAFIKHYLSDAQLSVVQAAKLAGYKHPHTDGSRIYKKLRHVIEAEAIKLKEGLQLSVEETMGMLAEVARDKSHKDRLRAIELSLKIHGMLNDKLILTSDRKTLESQLESALSTLLVAKQNTVSELSNVHGSGPSVHES